MKNLGYINDFWQSEKKEDCKLQHKCSCELEHDLEEKRLSENEYVYTCYICDIKWFVDSSG